MTKDEIEQILLAKRTLGFVKPTGSPDYVGWILLRKTSPAGVCRKWDALDANEDGHIIDRLRATWIYVELHPYLVQLREIRREVFNAKFETMDDAKGDYRLFESFFFASLDEVETFLRVMGYDIQDIRDNRDIEGP